MVHHDRDAPFNANISRAYGRAVKFLRYLSLGNALQEALFKGHISPQKYALYELHFCIKLPFFFKYFKDSTEEKLLHLP